MTAQKNQLGFTLIELLIAIAIVGALAGMAMIKLTGSTAQARDTRRETELKQYQTALEVYANSNAGRYPVAGGGTNITTICPTLSINPCVDDPQVTSSGLHYQYASDGFQYVLWAQLEKRGGPQFNQTQFFLLCSSGEAGKRSPNQGNTNGGSCPL